MRFLDNYEFLALLNEKKQEICKITKDGVQETSQFKRLSVLLTETRRKYAEKDDRLILIEKEELFNLCADTDDRVRLLFASPDFLTNRIVYINRDLDIIQKNNDALPSANIEARRYYENLSKEGFVVFQVAPDATLNYFIDGEDFGDGVFYSNDTRKSYEQLKTIDQLEDVLDKYRIHLTQQDTYLKFFVHKSGLLALKRILNDKSSDKDFVINHKHLLNNKPEELFREDLRFFLRQNMRVHICREELLDNLDRLDIQLLDEEGRDLYLIEIKWVGESVNDKGSGVSTKFDAMPRINPDAVEQVVGYIQQLLIEDKNLKCGYLIVFDARKEDMEDTGIGISEDTVTEEMRKYYFRFKKLKDFRVKNINPR